VYFYSVLPEAGAKRERSGSEAGASEASFSKNPRKRSVREASVIYIYNFLYILHLYSKKYVERQISCRIYENMHICTSI
jgi:hypothetical protein